MKYLKITLTLLLPIIFMGVAYIALWFLTDHFAYLFSHDVYESHLHGGLIPALFAAALLFGFIPALFFFSDIIWCPRVLSATQVKEVEAILIQEGSISLEIGQIFSEVGSNCGLRVKALKLNIFGDADFKGLEYCLQFSF